MKAEQAPGCQNRIQLNGKLKLVINFLSRFLPPGCTILRKLVKELLDTIFGSKITATVFLKFLLLKWTWYEPINRLEVIGFD